MDIIIFGAGISGLSAGYFLNQLGQNPIIFEKESKAGGLCRSERYGNLVFDHGIHVSFTNNQFVQGFFKDSINGNFNEFDVNCNNFWKGYWIKHQPHLNLHSLPKDVIKKTILDMIESIYSEKQTIENYQDWCFQKFGIYFSKNFTNKYTKKFWTLDANLLTPDWIEGRLIVPDLNSVFDGALNIPRSDKHYLTKYRYPKSGGYDSFLEKLKTTSKIILNRYPVEIDANKKLIKFDNSEIRKYFKLISSIPLPELIKIIKNVPSNIKIAVNKLKWTSLLLLNFKIKREVGTNPKWSYFFDEEISFSRNVFMARISPSNSPDKYETMQIEIPYSKFKPLIGNIDYYRVEVSNRLSTIYNLKIEEIEFLGSTEIKYAYVIFDFERKDALKIIHNFLDEKNIAYCGRFGEWEYLWSDQAFLSGKNIATQVLNDNE
jgi:protoporphyrinogen oxidase